MYATSGAVPAASAVVTFGRRSPVEVPPELACTTMFGCVALKVVARLLITVVVGGVCAVQNWSVTFPEELAPEELGSIPSMRPGPGSTPRSPPALFASYLVSLCRQPGPPPVIP